MRKIISDKTFDEERSLYNLVGTDVNNCVFAGPADGESVLKECRDISVSGCSFSLRYPLWHADGFTLSDSFLDDKTRAPLWYSRGGLIQNTKIEGVKTLRECDDVRVAGCMVKSPEFGWRCRDIRLSDTDMESEYFLFESKNIQIDNLRMKGKYSFQYVENMTIRDSVLDTKDAFWHAKNITVENSVVKGEYLGWFSEGLTLINCKILGTQPLCYCKNLKLINCTTEGCDLSFEYSDVIAEISGNILSIKNPKSGTITADSADEIIMGDAVTECAAEIIIGGKRV